jgi:hypothetical protein
MRYKTLALAAAAIMAGMLSFGGAQATVMSGARAPEGITKMTDSNVQQASHRRHRHRWRSGIFLGFGLAPFFHRPYYYDPYYSPYYSSYPYYYRPHRYSYVSVGGSRHVRWCLNHYRTYDPRSNTFIGYDGYRHRCRSPYRY